MLIRKLAIAGFVLAVVGLTATVTTVVIGQQPGTTEKNSGAAETAPAAGAATGTTDAPKGSGLAQPPTSDDNLPAAEKGSPAGTASSTDDEAKAPAKGPPGTGTGSTSGGSKGRGKGVEKKPRSSAGAGAMVPAGTMPGMPGMAGMGAGMPAMPSMMGGMMIGGGGGTMSVPVSEDEHLETWVNQALAEYARMEDQDARKQQREQIAKALDRIFDIRQDRRMEELETLEQRVQKLRGTLETREKLKTDILKNRLDYLIREADGLGWGDGPPAAGRSLPTGMGPPAGMGTGSGSILPKRPAGFNKKTSDTPSGASAPRKGLEFLAAYPKLHGLSLEMTEQQFLEIVASQKLKSIKNEAGGSRQYLVPTGDGHTVIVMFRKENGDKCGGIQRVRGEAGDDGKVDEAPRRESRERGRSTGGSGAGSGSSSAGSDEELPKQ